MTRSRWLSMIAILAASPAAAQESAVLVLRAADTAWVRQEADAGRFADMAVDGELVGHLLARDAPLAVRPGLHHVVVTMLGYTPFSDTVRVEAGARVLVTVRLGRGGPVAVPLSARPVLPAGSWVRVHSAGARTEGQIAVASADTLYLSGQPPLHLAAADSVWVRKSSWRRGGTVGAVIGGLLAGAFVYAGTHWEGTQPGAGGDTAAAAVVGAGGGFLLGAAIGAAIPRWQLGYSR